MYKVEVKLKIDDGYLLIGVNYPDGAWDSYEYTKYYFYYRIGENSGSWTNAMIKFHHKEILEVLNDMGKLREFVKVLIKSHLKKVNNGLEINKVHEKISELNKMGIEFSFDDKELT